MVFGLSRAMVQEVRDVAQRRHILQLLIQLVVNSSRQALSNLKVRLRLPAWTHSRDGASMPAHPLNILAHACTAWLKPSQA